MVKILPSFRVVTPTLLCVHLPDDSLSPSSIQHSYSLEKKRWKAIMRDGHHKWKFYAFVGAPIIRAHQQKHNQSSRKNTEAQEIAAKEQTEAIKVEAIENPDSVVRWSGRGSLILILLQDTANCRLSLVDVVVGACNEDSNSLRVPGKYGTAHANQKVQLHCACFEVGSVDIAEVVIAQASQREPLIETQVDQLLHIACANGCLAMDGHVTSAAAEDFVLHYIAWPNVNDETVLLNKLEISFMRADFRILLSSLQLQNTSDLISELHCSIESSLTLHDGSQSGSANFLLAVGKVNGVTIRVKDMAVTTPILHAAHLGEGDVFYNLLHIACREESIIGGAQGNGSRHQVLATKTPFEMNTPNSKLLLIEGRPGTGKSTLSFELCRKWDTKSLQEIKIILLLKQGRSPLHFRIYLANEILLEFLSYRTVLCNAGKSFLHIACEGGKTLLFGCDSLGTGLTGRSFLHNACSVRSVRCIIVVYNISCSCLLHPTCLEDNSQCFVKKCGQSLKLAVEVTGNGNQLYLFHHDNFQNALSLEHSRNKFQKYAKGYYNIKLKSLKKCKLMPTNANSLGKYCYTAYYFRVSSTHETFNDNEKPTSNIKKMCLLDSAFDDFFTTNIFKIENSPNIAGLFPIGIQIYNFCGYSEIVEIIKINLQKDNIKQFNLPRAALNKEGYHIVVFPAPIKGLASYSQLLLCFEMDEVFIQQKLLSHKFAASNSQIKQSMLSDFILIPLCNIWRLLCYIRNSREDAVGHSSCVPNINCNNIEISIITSAECSDDIIEVPLLRCYAEHGNGLIYLEEIVCLKERNRSPQQTAYISCENAYSNNRIQNFKELFVWVKKFIASQRIACDSSGNVYVVDSIDHIQVFTSLRNWETLEKVDASSMDLLSLYDTTFKQKFAALTELKELWQLLTLNNFSSLQPWKSVLKVMKPVLKYTDANGHNSDIFFLAHLLADLSHKGFTNLSECVVLNTKENWISENRRISFRKPEIIMDSCFFPYRPPETLQIDNDTSKVDCFTMGVAIFQMLAMSKDLAEDSSCQDDVMTQRKLQNENGKSWKNQEVHDCTALSIVHLLRMLYEVNASCKSFLNDNSPPIMVKGSFGIGKTRLLASTYQGDYLSTGQDTMQKTKSLGVSTCTSGCFKEQILTYYKKSIVSCVKENYYDSHCIVIVFVICTPETGKNSFIEPLKKVSFEMPESCKVFQTANIFPTAHLSNRYSIYDSHRVTKVLVIRTPGEGKSESLKGVLSCKVSESCNLSNTASIIPSVHLSSRYSTCYLYDIIRVLVEGSPGTGKSSLIESLIRKFSCKVPESSDTASIVPGVHLRSCYSIYDSQFVAKLLVIGTQKSSNMESLKREFYCKVLECYKPSQTAGIISTVHLSWIYDFAEYYSSHAAIIVSLRKGDNINISVKFEENDETFETLSYSIFHSSLEIKVYIHEPNIFNRSSLLLWLLDKDFITVAVCPVLSHIKDCGMWVPSDAKALHVLEGSTKKSVKKFANKVPNLDSCFQNLYSVLRNASRIFSEDIFAGILPTYITKDCLIHCQYCLLISNSDDVSKEAGLSHQPVVIFPALCSVNKTQVIWDESTDVNFSIGWPPRCSDYQHFFYVILLRLVFQYTLTRACLNQRLSFDQKSATIQPVLTKHRTTFAPNLALDQCASQDQLGGNQKFYLKSRQEDQLNCLICLDTYTDPKVLQNLNTMIQFTEFASSLSTDDIQGHLACQHHSGPPLQVLQTCTAECYGLLVDQLASCQVQWEGIAIALNFHTDKIKDTLKTLQDFKIVLLFELRGKQVQNATYLHQHRNEELHEGVVGFIIKLCHQKHFSCDVDTIIENSRHVKKVLKTTNYFNTHDLRVHDNVMEVPKETFFNFLQLTYFYYQIIIIYVATNICRLAFSLSLLLLLAGDVETNPGPTDSNTKADLSDVVTIPNVEMKWKELGLALRLSTKQLAEIEAKHKKPIRCKREMFRQAVKSHVTWKEIIIGLCNIGMRSNVKEVCVMFDISLNGLSAYVNSSGQTPETVEPDGAEAVTSSMSSATEQKTPSKEAVEIGTFRSISTMLAREVSRDPIMLANAVYSRGIITQDNLHQLRVMPSNATIVSRLIKLIEATIFQYPFKFEAFVDALRSISIHANLAAKILRIHRFNLVGHKMRKVSLSEVDLNHLSAELNNLKLISDDTRISAARAANSTDMCSVLLSELQAEELGDQFLNLLGSYPNTKIICERLRLTYRSSTDSDSGVTSQSFASQSIEMLPKSHSPRKPKTVETQFTSRDSPTMASTDIVMAKSSGSASADGSSHSSSVAKASEPVTQDLRSADSSDAYLSAEGNSREFPMQRLDSVVLPQAGSEIAGKGTGTLNPVTKKFTADSKDYEAVVPRQKLPQTTQQTGAKVYDPVLPKPKPSSSVVATLAQPKLTKQEADDFSSVLMKWDASQVEARLKKNIAYANYEYKGKRTPLMLAAVEGSKDVVRVLLQYKPSLTAVDSEGYNPLFLAATNGNYEVVKMLLEQPNPQLHVKNYRGIPLLVEPARKGFSMITDLLLQHGAKVNEETPDGETALYVACKKGHLDVVKVLLASNVDVSKECKKTQLTPLEEAVQGDNSDIVRLLMKAVASIKKKSKELFTSTNPDTIKSLISKGAKIDTRNNEEATPLIVHTKLTHLEIVKELIDLRANVDLQDVRGYSALIYAAKGGSWEIVQILVARGAILDLKEKEYGFTALMFAITHKRPRIVKELVLAKANVAIRNLDNKSSLDLAREGGHPEILEVMELTPTLSSGKDPFLNILSTYMAEKGKEKRSEASRPSQRPSSASKPVKVVTHPLVPEENSAHVAEVKKYQRRIADLETRIHDLTIMGAMEIAEDNDLTYMERSRLESEFKKLKESKKKAEQYSIEAKQTAQRLSAENFKLREDLSKERHMNELSRKNMMREVEMNVERLAVQSKMEAIRKDVFDNEVEKMATQRMAKAGSVAQRVEISEVEIEEVVLKSDITVEMFHLIISGLPESGKSAIVKSVFNPTKMKTNTGLSLYEVIILRNKSGSIHHWIEGEKVQSMVHAVALGFARHMKESRQLPILGSNQKAMKIFDDSEAQETFELACKHLQELLFKLEHEDRIANLLTGSMSLVNVYDFKNSKGATEFDKAVGGRNSHLLKINVFDLSKHGKDEITKKSDIQEDQLSMHPGNTVLHQIVSRIESLSMYQSPSVVVVGTHADKIPDLKQQTKEVMDLINHCCDEMNVPPDTYLPEMVTVNATDEKSCKPLHKAIIQLIETNKHKFTIRIPVRFILLRYVLFSTSKMYMSRKELISYAKKCKCKEDEVEHFLEIFRKCASIISSSEKGEFLYNYVVLLPVEFFHHLDKLYNVMDDKVLPADLKKPAAYGILQEEVVHSIWQGTVDSSIPNHEFFVSALKNVRLIIEVGKKYFVPSLRTKLDSDPVSPRSLVISITSHVSLTPFSGKQYMFVTELLSLNKKNDPELDSLNEEIIVLDEECPYYNVISLIWKQAEEEARIRIRFFTDSIDVTILPVKAKSVSKSFSIYLHSILKTNCVSIMNKISDRRKLYQDQEYRYRFSIVCPKKHDHLIPFDIVETTMECLSCPKCSYECHSDADLLWVKSAFQGSHRSALDKNDIINPKNLLAIAELLSSLKIREIELLNKKLNHEKLNSPSSEAKEALFHVLYMWYCRNLNVTRRRLAKVLQECNFHKQALSLDPSLLDADTASSNTTFSTQEVTYIAESWTQTTEELAAVLSIDGQKSKYDVINAWLQEQEGDKRDKLAKKFELIYPNFANLISDIHPLL